MIRCRNCFVSIIKQRSHLPAFVTSRKLCSSNENKEQVNADDERIRHEKHDQFIKRALILKGSFESTRNKDKFNYLDMIRIYEDKEKQRRNHVEFIYVALKNMEDYGVHKDLQMYKALINVMPKGKFIPTNIFQAEFMHYPKQQQCIIDLLEQMEDNGDILCFFFYW